MRLADKVILGSGGTSGIGRSITGAWLVEEASVLISNIRSTELNDLRTVTFSEGHFATKASK
jgi:short-subunit dehydrogenase involved in D-alanine esterification of teichoic acids